MNAAVGWFWTFITIIKISLDFVWVVAVWEHSSTVGGGYCTYRYRYIYVFVTSLSTDREKELFFFFLGGKRVWGCMPLVLICFFGVLFLFVTSVETGHKVDFRLERVLLTIGVSLQLSVQLHLYLFCGGTEITALYGAAAHTWCDSPAVTQTLALSRRWCHCGGVNVPYIQYKTAQALRHTNVWKW